MATKTKENPFGIDPARDLHHSPPRLDVPFWSENLLFTGVDTENGIFLWKALHSMFSRGALAILTVCVLVV